MKGRGCLCLVAAFLLAHSVSSQAGDFTRHVIPREDGGEFFAAMTNDSSDLMHYAFWNSAANQLWYGTWRRPGPPSQSDHLLVDNGDDGDVTTQIAIAVSDNGRVHVAYVRDENELVMAVLEPGSNAFQKQTIHNAATMLLNPTIAMLGTRIEIALREASAQSTRWIARLGIPDTLSSPLGSWTFEQVIEITDRVSSVGLVLFGAGGTEYAYEEDEPGNVDVRRLRIVGRDTPTTLWGPAVTIFDAPGFGQTISLEYDDAGNLFASAATPRSVTYAKREGSVWSAPVTPVVRSTTTTTVMVGNTNVTTTTSRMVSDSRLSLDSAGQPHFWWWGRTTATTIGGIGPPSSTTNQSAYTRPSSGSEPWVECHSPLHIGLPRSFVLTPGEGVAVLSHQLLPYSIIPFPPDELSAISIDGPGDDFDRDGVPYLVEMGTKSSDSAPTDVARSRLQFRTVSILVGTPPLQFRVDVPGFAYRRISGGVIDADGYYTHPAENLKFKPGFSDDGETWTDNGNAFTEVSATDLGDGTEFVHVRQSNAQAPADRIFRLGVERID